MHIPESQIEHLLDAALDSYPLTPVPPGLVRRTLARIRPQPVAKFRLDFLDFAVPSFLVLFILLTVGVALWTLNYLNPYWMVEWSARLAFTRQWMQFKLMQIPAWLPVLGVTLGGVFLTGCGLVMILILERSLLSFRLKH